MTSPAITPKDRTDMSELVDLVRPLRWKEPHPSHSYPNWYAMVPNVKFEARIDTSKPRMYGDFPLSINGALVVQKFDTVEDAKAYAQRQYAERVASCLTPDPRITRLEADRVELIAALEGALDGLKRASRQLTSDHSLVLNGKRWGGLLIDASEAALAKVRIQGGSNASPAHRESL